MKKKLLISIAAALCVSGLCLNISVRAADKEADKEHKHAEDDHGHKHAEKKAGPNGGRLITSLEPHVEFLVLKDRRVQITFVDDHNKKVAPQKQSLRVTAGDRKKPTKLAFEKKGDVLISDKALPAGDDYPVILQIKPGKRQKSVIEKFVLDLGKCPTCKYLEYACICDHGEHDHDDDEKQAAKQKKK